MDGIKMTHVAADGLLEQEGWSRVCKPQNVPSHAGHAVDKALAIHRKVVICIK
jgi:hypothetical protein